MLTIDRNTHVLSGKLDFAYEYINFKGQEDTVKIHHIHSLSEKGFYIDWSMESSGFGQYSIHLSPSGWSIDNEGMGINSSSYIITALEKGLLELQDSKINYILDKLKHNMYEHCMSLTQGLTLIWTSAVEERNTQPEDVNIPITIDLLKITRLSIDIDSSPIKPHISYVDLYLDFDYKWLQFGQIYFHKTIDSINGSSYSISQGLKKETLFAIVEIFNNINIKKLEKKNSIEKLEKIKEIQVIWELFKKECHLPDDIEQLVNVLYKEDKRKHTSYFIR